MSPASTPIGDLNSPAAQSKTHSPQHRHSPSASDKQGAVTITLHTLKDDFDEKAQVKVELSNPDAVVEKMLSTLANKFPPESVITIAKGHRDISEGSSSSLDSSSRATASSDAGLSPIGDTLHKPSRLSGRYYLGPNNEYYPELADSKGRPIVEYVRNPSTGGALPVGRQVIGANGRPFPFMIMGPNGKPIPGVPVPPEGLDEVGRPFPCYSTIDGHFFREAVSPSGRPLLGFAYDRFDGEIKRVGPAVIGPNGQPIKGMIQTPNGEVIPGIPLNPVRRPSAPSIESKLQQRGSPQHSQFPCQQQCQLPAYSGTQSATCSSNLLPNYTALDGTRLPIVESPNGTLLLGFAKDPKDGQVKAVGPPFYDIHGHTVPGFITASDGRRSPGIAIMVGETTPSPQSPVSFPRGPPSYLPSPQRQVPPSVLSSHDVAVKIPAPSYALFDGTYAPLAVGQDGRPLDGYGQDPKTGSILPVGRPHYSSKGELMDGMIVGLDGNAIPGLQLAPHGWHIPSRQPLPIYLTTDQQWAQMYVDPDGHCIHGWAKDPKDGQTRPVGIQAVDEHGRPILGTIIGSDGRPAHGIPLDVDNTAISLPFHQISTATNHLQPSMTHSTGDGNDFLVRYVEVPVIEEKIIEVHKREVREIEKRVPKVEIVEVVKEVQVPQIQYVEKHVEIPKIEQVIREVKVKQIVDRPFDVLIHKPKIETKIVEQIKEVPGEIVEVPRIERHEQPVYVPRYVDKEVPAVVAQKLQPVLRQVSKINDVHCTVTQPKVVTVDVFIPKPVASTLNVGGMTGETHRTVDIPAAQFNALTRRLNISLDASHIEQLYVKEGAGVPILPAGERVETVEPVSTQWSANHQVGKIHCCNATEVPKLYISETLGLCKKSHQYRGLDETVSFSTTNSYVDDSTEIAYRHKDSSQSHRKLSHKHHKRHCKYRHKH